MKKFHRDLIQYHYLLVLLCFDCNSGISRSYPPPYTRNLLGFFRSWPTANSFQFSLINLWELHTIFVCSQLFRKQRCEQFLQECKLTLSSPRIPNSNTTKTTITIVMITWIYVPPQLIRSSHINIIWLFFPIFWGIPNISGWSMHR